MSVRFPNGIDLLKGELRNSRLQNLAAAPSSPVLGQAYFDTAGSTNRPKWYAGATDGWVQALTNLTRLDQISAPTTSVGMNSQRITSLADGVNPQDAATVKQLTDMAQGLDWKPSVKVRTTASITLSGLQTIDNIALSANDRVLVMNQNGTATDPANGIYLAQTGAWTRATDADTGAELSGGAAVYVEEGTLYADTAWAASHNGVPTLGTTPLGFIMIGSQAAYTASNGLEKVGNDFRIDLDANSGLVLNAGGLAIGTGGVTNAMLVGMAASKLTGTVALANGGLGVDASDTAGKKTARTNLAAATVFTQDFGDGVATTFTITHNFGTRSVSVTVLDLTSGDIEFPDVNLPAAGNTAVITYAEAPTASSKRVTIVGLG